MCGIYGIIDYKNELPNPQKIQLLRILGVMNEKRGSEAAGLCMLQADGRKRIVKGKGLAHELDFTVTADARVVLGHTRQGTIGGKEKEQAHPFTYRNWVLTHNGFGPGDYHKHDWAKGPSGVDSEGMLRYLVATGGTDPDNITRFYEAWDSSSFSFAMLNDKNEFQHFRSSNPFFFSELKDSHITVYSSEQEHLEQALKFVSLEGKTFYTKENQLLTISETQPKPSIVEFKAPKITTKSYKSWKGDYDITSYGGTSYFPQHRSHTNGNYRHDRNGGRTSDKPPAKERT